MQDEGMPPTPPGENDADARALIARARDRFRAGDPSGAERLLRDALALEPGSAQAALRLGLLLRGQGRDAESLVPLRSAVAASPDLAVAHAALAAALHATGQLEAAAESAQRALALSPAERDLAANLAVIRNAQGLFADAEAVCRQALEAGSEPGLLNTLGVALKEAGRLAEAAAVFEEALALKPGFVEARYNLAGVRKDQGRTDEAVGLLREVVRLAPGLPAARFALCMAHLPPLYGREEEVAARRAAYGAELDALIGHAAQVGAATLADGVGAAQPFYLAYQGRNDAELQRRYGELVCRAMAEAFPPTPLASQPAPGGRLRVGIVSGYFRDHSVWRLPARGWVREIDRSRFELIGYHTSALRDAETGRAEALFDRFVQGPMPTAAWREKIAADQPHVLIYPEIGMDPMTARLAALRLAPAQYASWGHPSTSGYPTIDYFLTSAAMEPADAEIHYTERLVRLPGLSTPMLLEPATVEATPRAALGLTGDEIVYWCGQSLYKYLPRHDGLFARIAAREGRARFLFLDFPGSPELTLRFRERLSAAFAGRGLVAEDHCRFLPGMRAEAFRAAMGAADVVLDSVDWSGCNSLLEALALGLPVVTLPGETMRSRHGAAILQAPGLDGLICTGEEGYVDLAVRLGCDAATRGSLGPAIQSRLAALASTAAVRALEDHIRQASAEATERLSACPRAPARSRSGTGSWAGPTA